MNIYGLRPPLGDNVCNKLCINISYSKLVLVIILQVFTARCHICTHHLSQYYCIAPSLSPPPCKAARRAEIPLASLGLTQALCERPSNGYDLIRCRVREDSYSSLAVAVSATAL